MIQAIRRSFVDNPVTRRMLTTTMTGPRLGVAILLVNAALLIAYGCLFALFVESAIDSEDYTGAMIYFFQNVVLYGALAIFLPIKVAGTIDGARVTKTLDQLVVTGVSPLSCFLGCWAVGLLYAFLLLLPSVPFVAGAAVFGDVDLGLVAESYGILLLYSNAIILVSLAASTRQREWASVPLVIIFFALLGIFSAIPEYDWVWGYPNHVAELSPLRYFGRCVLPEGEISRYAHLVFEGPYFFGVQIPLTVYPFLMWGLVSLGSLVVLALGLAHQFSRGLNNVGTVVFEAIASDASPAPSAMRFHGMWSSRSFTKIALAGSDRSSSLCVR